MSTVTTVDRSPGTHRPPSRASRQGGYVVGVVVNAILLFLVNVAPGWQAATFLTPQFQQVLGLVNLCLTVSLVANLVYVVADPVWVKSLGDAINAALAMAISVELLDIFPFDFTGWATDWSPLVRGILVFALVAALIGLIVSIVRFVIAVVRAATRR